MSDLDLTYPAIADLRARAKRRIPHFAFEYLDSATGAQKGTLTNRRSLDAIRFMPDILKGGFTPGVTTRFMGRDYDLPIAVAPVGMSGMIWPKAEMHLAQAAVAGNIPYCQSTVAAADPEEVAPHIGQNGWFQHYPVNTPEIRRDMLRRIRDAGFGTLVMTVDVPGEARRERQRRAYVAMPPRMTLKVLATMAARPRWCLEMLKSGAPRMPFPESYAPASGKDAFVHAGRVIRGWPDWAYLRAVRDEWSGQLIVKGVLQPDDAVELIRAGVDGIWVSNHAARQFEGGPAAIDQLPKVRAALGPDVPVIFDSGIEGGLDILRAVAMGADLVALGRAFHYAVGALGRPGIDHLVHILRADLIACMTQIGAKTLGDVPGRLIR